MKHFVWGMLLLLMAGMVQAVPFRSYTVTYDVVGDKAVVEATLQLSQFHSFWEMPLPRDAKAIEVPGREFAVVEEEERTLLKITGPGLFNALTVKYITSSVIEKAGDRFFILDLDGIEAEQKSLTLKLPENAALKYRLDSGQASIIPATENVRTDGRQIIINWGPAELEAAGSVLVRYTLPAGMPLWVWAAVALLVVAAAGAITAYFWRMPAPSGKKHPAVSAAELTRNLFEEEKKVVEVLLAAKGKELWQKELALKSGLSKVKLSRKLRSLEQKGIVEKIPYGNTNKIRLRTEQGKKDTSPVLPKTAGKRKEKTFMDLSEL